jgi:adenosylcobinamide-phosphate synthase
MRLELQILAAFALDLIFGDPRWMPHPVKLIGRLALALENPLRKLISMTRAAGILVACIVVGLTGLSAWALIHCSRLLHPHAGDVMSVLLLYTAFASRDLMSHSYRVYASLRDRDIEEARRRAALLVGRDTGHLDEPEIARAAVESVAENLVDGVTAPLFFAVLGGPVGAMLYKAASTLDSMFGYKDKRYLLFGWASARLDDAATYLPTRLTMPLLAVAATILGFRPVQCIRICLRDGSKHDSPNSGLAEAAMAGALGIQLGGLNYYGGEAHEGARIGDPGRTMIYRDILSANRLMLGTSLLCLFVWTGARALILGSF